MSVPEVFRSPAQVAPYVEEWRALAASLPWSSYFTAPDWQLTWWEVLGRGRRAEIALWRGRDGLDAVVGVARERLHPRIPLVPGPWVTLGSGAGAADHLGWLVRPDREDEVRHWLRTTCGRWPVVLPHTDPESGTAALLPGARPIGGSACPRVDLGAADLPTGSSSLRKRVRHDERRLADEGITLGWREGTQLDAATFDALVLLHGYRAGGQGWSTTFTAERRRFHLELIARARRGCGPAAVVASRGEHVIGVLYGFRWREVFAYYQTGWDPAYARHGLGTVLVATAMRAARASGCTVFDFLRGAEPYKYRFGAVDREDTTWVRARGPVRSVLRARYATQGREVATAEEGAPRARALRD